MSNVVIGAVESAHDAFMNWILPYTLAGGIAFGLIALVVLAAVVVASGKKHCAD